LIDKVTLQSGRTLVCRLHVRRPCNSASKKKTLFSLKKNTFQFFKKKHFSTFHFMSQLQGIFFVLDVVPIEKPLVIVSHRACRVGKKQ